MANDAIPRMSLTRSLRSELLRLSRSPLIWLHLLCGLAGGLACGEYFSVAAWDASMGADAYAQFLGALIPLMTSIVCGLAVDEERSAGKLANLTAVPSRGRAVLAVWAALSLLGACALATAFGTFGIVLAAAHRLTLGAHVLATAWAGCVLGSLPLYALELVCAFRFGRNATIGVGATGTLLAFFSIGGLAHGLMTGELTGAFPSILGWLGIESAIVAGRDAAQAAAVSTTAIETAVACAVLLAAAIPLFTWWFRRFEDRGLHV